ncbi:dipeptidyl peptidase III [Emericellopsis atlantica]|uniref:Dipeptidyl peptidase III n=1 Tax=Emericellopsis atlantica TaxID=2614577 RepID=A0A9P8CK95_9HYPO|nr:dipeptidyl peptidase III [Emericellopsis atlantica]KAG9250319.1 dipeptidyl peptidase III [Emericellopsis atlantica]
MAPVYQLTIEEVFNRLTARERLYAHHVGRAVWYGSRIVMRQTSPESEGIYDFILELHKACGGQWSRLVDAHGAKQKDVDALLEFAAQFLAHLGNYYAMGDRKVVPQVAPDALREMAKISVKATRALENVIEPMFAVPPYHLGYPGETTQSTYYSGNEPITVEEIGVVANIMEKHHIEPENTRVHKWIDHMQATPVFDIVQASVEDSAPITLETTPEAVYRVTRGSHAAELSMVCEELEKAAEYASNETQASLARENIKYFQTGDIEHFFSAQRLWATDRSPRVEHVIGFMESYRDPYGVRCEWEGIASISDPDETSKLDGLIQDATKFIRLLPWAVPGENDGKGPFEPSEFTAPNFTIVHALAFCNSTVWDGCNLPNYGDIRETYGAKNIVFSNRLRIKEESTPLSAFVDPSEAGMLKTYSGTVHFIKNAIHELLGHGTGKLLSETAPGVFNFDRDNPPTNPLTDAPVETWYKFGQAWQGVFNDLANSIEECRATLVSYFLPAEREVLSVFGLDDEDTVADFVYYLYLTIGTLGLESLASFNSENRSWGDQHHRGDFAIFKHLLLDGGDVMSVDYNADARTVRVNVDRSKIISHGKPSLGRLVLRLHVWRCIANVDSCREFYEPLTNVDGEYEAWRQVVVSAGTDGESSLVRTDPGGKIVQANTFLTHDGGVELRVYEQSNEGIVQSFFERAV